MSKASQVIEALSTTDEGLYPGDCVVTPEGKRGKIKSIDRSQSKVRYVVDVDGKIEYYFSNNLDKCK